MTRLASPDQIILGTMRWPDCIRTVEEWADFLQSVANLGITKLHSSSEYDSFPLLCSALDALRQRTNSPAFQHVVKLANPHFDEATFDADRLEAQLADYCAALGTDRIDDVQWMWRAGLDDDPARLAAFAHAASMIGDTAESLRQRGRIGRWLCFPYGPDFAMAAAQSPAIDGLVVYRNRQERSEDAAIAAAAALGKPTLIIRPFAAGAAFDAATTPADLLTESLAPPGVEAAILSSNSIAHLTMLVAC